METRQLELTRDIYRWVLLTVIFLIPVFFLRSAADPINVPKLGLLFVGVSAALSARLLLAIKAGDLDWPRPLLIPASAVLAPLLIALLLSPFRVWELMGDYPRFLGLLPYAFSILMGILVADAFKGSARQVALTLVAAGSVTGLYAVVQYVGLDPYQWSQDTGVFVSSTLGNPNFTGGFLGLCLPLTYGLWRSGGLPRTLLAVAAACQIGGLVASTSQAAIAAAAGGLAVTFGILLSGKAAWARLAGGSVAILIALGAVIGISLGAQGRFIPESLERRGEWWASSLRMAADHPFVGEGPNSFALLHGRYRSVSDVEAAGFSIERDPHSVPLAWLTGAGVLGALGFFILVGWFVRQGTRLPSDRVLAAAFFGAAAVYLLQMLVSIDVVAIRTSFWVVLGGMVASTSSAVPDSVKATRSRAGAKRKKSRSNFTRKVQREPRELILVTAAVVGGGAVAAMGLWVGVRLVVADLSFQAAEEAADSSAFEVTQARYEESLGFRREPRYLQGQGSYLGSLAVAVREQGGTEQAAELMNAASDAMDYSQSLDDPSGALTYARLMRDWASVQPDAVDMASNLFARAVELDPRNYFLLNEAGETALSFERWSEAEAYFRDSLSKNSEQNMYAALALALAQQDKRQVAAEALAGAVPADPYYERARTSVEEGA